MKYTNYIRSLATRQMSFAAYRYIISTVKGLITQHNWPKSILDESTKASNSWKDEEIVSFTHQVIAYILEKNKLKNIDKVPDSYVLYYFKTIIVSYVAKKVKDNQSKSGLSFESTKRISLEILKDQYFQIEIENLIFWSKDNKFDNLISTTEELDSRIQFLPKIKIIESTKHYKPLVKVAIRDIFETINCAIEQTVLLSKVYKLFDQKGLIDIEAGEQEREIRVDAITVAIRKTNKELDKNEKALLKDYFFSDPKMSIADIAEKYNLPKSTAHFKLKRITKVITGAFIPMNDEEGIYFLEELDKILDDK